MQKIDRLGWADGIALYAHGLRIGVRVNRPGVLDRVAEVLPRSWEPSCTPFVDMLYSLKLGDAAPGSRVRTYTLLYGGLTKLARTMDLGEALEALERDLLRYVGEHARNRVFVHAGVVGWRGRAILLPGRSMAGKSTLVAALLRAGADYYSDEYAVLDGRGHVHPDPRRLSLRLRGDLRRSAGPEEFGSRAGTVPLPVGLVAVTRYHPGGRWRPRPVTPGQTVLELMNHSLAAQTQPQMVLATLHRAARTSRNLKTLRGEAEETAEALLRAAEHLPAGDRLEPALAG
jgi:hypothetical protein